MQFLLDNVIKSAMRVEGGLGAIQTRLMNAYKVNVIIVSLLVSLTYM